MAEQIYVARVTANALAAGRFVVLVAGKTVALSPEEADELLRIHFVARAARGKVTEAETAAVAPAETADAPAQQTKARKAGAR